MTLQITASAVRSAHVLHILEMIQTSAHPPVVGQQAVQVGIGVGIHLRHHALVVDRNGRAQRLSRPSRHATEPRSQHRPGCRRSAPREGESGRPCGGQPAASPGRAWRPRNSCPLGRAAGAGLRTRSRLAGRGTRRDLVRWRARRLRSARGRGNRATAPVPVSSRRTRRGALVTRRAAPRRRLAGPRRRGLTCRPLATVA